MSDESYKVLKNEAFILKEMNHPNIVKFYNVREELRNIFTKIM
jgi:serine/threonine protein kinase